MFTPVSGFAITSLDRAPIAGKGCAMSKILLLKTTSATGGVFAVANPLAKPGPQASGAHVYRIVGIPESVPNEAVILAAEYSILLDPAKHRWTYVFSDLGSGKIVR